MSAPAMRWSCQGADEIVGILAQARTQFPGLTIEPRTRDIGFGLVIDDVRVQDVLPQGEDGVVSAGGSGGPSADHPMHEQQVSSVRTVAVWQEDFLTPMRLNLPVRLSVRHDDLQVHEITVEFPAALLKRALGMYVDPLEMSLSEVQSLFIAPEGAGFTTRTLATPGLAPTPPAPPETEVVPAVSAPKPRRRFRRFLLAALVTLLAVAVGGSWWALQGPGSAEGAPAPTPSPSAIATPTASPSGQVTPSTQPSSSVVPTVTHAKPSDTPAGKPNVTLHSEMAFAFNSATLSPQAKQAIDQVAHQVRSAGLSGKIYVDGYTDNLGSEAYGLVLSQRRADAVSHYLGSQLVGVPVSIVSTGHGEKNPVADNSTNHGRKANRRVTITLPTS